MEDVLIVPGAPTPDAAEDAAERPPETGATSVVLTGAASSAGQLLVDGYRLEVGLFLRWK